MGKETVAFKRSLTPTQILTDENTETNVDVNGRKDFTLMDTQSSRSVESYRNSDPLMWDDDDDTCTDMSSITKETYATKTYTAKHFGTRWLDFIESRVIPSPFCLATQGQVACGGDDNTKFEWRIPGLGRCRIAIE